MIHPMKILTLLKDMLFAYDEYKDNGRRFSEQMLTGVAGIIISALVAFGVFPTGIENEATEIVLGILSGLWNAWYMVLRVRSNGAPILMRGELGAKVQPAYRPPDDTDEHVPR